MSTIRLENLTIPAADIGSQNPLPDLNTIQYIHAGIHLGDHVTPEDSRFMGYGMIKTILPYTILDGYDRERHQKSFRTVILENEHLRAVFIPELGGRLWSLYQKDEHRELLYVNPVFQPGNLALRNAWFSGGIEWNIGIKGHNPYTCDPLHAEIVENEEMKILRLYEFERIRQVVYQIEACLPSGSKVLYIKTKITNPQSETVPMYWWTNMAVPETSGTRVIVPAEEAFQCLYNHGDYSVERIKVPDTANGDCSYPTNLPRVIDYFFIIPQEKRKWIAAVQSDGIGLAETSTDQLIGRKVFQWGMSSGGRHWQEFLSIPNHPYLEIQSGLARTQLEHLPMKSGECWEFIETFGMVKCDPAIVFGSSWSDAQQEVENGIANMNTDTLINQLFRQWADLSILPGQPIIHGSGWGALENYRRFLADQPVLCSALRFPDCTLGIEQEDWLQLLDHGRLPERSPSAAPESFMIQEEWMNLVEASLQKPKGRHWYSLYILRLMKYAAGDAILAGRYWRESIAMQPTAWTYRNLARLEFIQGNLSEATEFMITARGLAQDSRHIAQEFAEMMVRTGNSQVFLDQLVHMLPDLAAHPRIRFMEAAALCELGRTNEARLIISQSFVMPDIREGEISLADLWMKINQMENSEEENAAPPLPYHLDFRMN